MTQIDFYILKNEKESGILFTCKLVDKVYHMDRNVYIHTQSQQQSQQLNEMLWTFKPGSFLPHELSTSQASRSPIVIGNDATPSSNDVLINVSGSVPGFFSQFERVAEIVHGDDSDRVQARQNYKFYKDRGYKLNTYNIGD